MTSPKSLSLAWRQGQKAIQVLRTNLQKGKSLPAVLPLLQILLDASVPLFNSIQGPRYLIRLATEVVPTHPRYISAVRARMGGLIELSLAAIWNDFLNRKGDKNWRVSINYVTEYPNLYLRDWSGNIYLRIETKALHDEADEGAARFDTVTPLIDPSLDVLIVIGWKWKHDQVGSNNVAYPVIFAAGAYSAIEIAKERDTRFRLLGGKFRSGGIPYVPSKKDSKKLVEDPGNYGKLNRIVHSSRKLNQLSSEVTNFVLLLGKIYPKRMRVAAENP